MNVANVAFWLLIVLTLFIAVYSLIPKYAVPRYVAYANSPGVVQWKKRLWYCSIVFFPALVAAVAAFWIIFSVDFRAEESTHDKISILLMLFFSSFFIGFIFNLMLKNLKGSDDVR